jgi:phenylacetate-CoA ligase
MRRHPHVAREEIVAFQNTRLRRLVAHAYMNIPYYQRLFERNGLTPRDIQSVADLPAIPLTSKADLQMLPAREVVARGVDPQRLITRRTSGASGEPFTIRRTWFEDRLLFQFRRRATRTFGVRSTDKTANIVLFRPTPHPRPPLPLRLHPILDSFHQSFGLYRQVRLNCLLPPRDLVATLQEYRPDVLTGFPGVLSQLAQVLDAAERRVIRPRLVIVGAEVLTPLMRQRIMAAFSAPVFDCYGSHEFNLIAWECPVTGEFHLCDDSVIVEVLKDGRPVAEGEQGEVVGTNLHSFAMPFIRYRLGDVVTKGADTCRCGQPFSTIRNIQGRMIDYFPLPDGRLLHPYKIVLILMNEAAAWIQQYQLTQERKDKVLLQVVPLTTPTTAELDRLVESVVMLLGPGVDFRVALVAEIKLETSGKFRVSRSLVGSEYEATRQIYP